MIADDRAVERVVVITNLKQAHIYIKESRSWEKTGIKMPHKAVSAATATIIAWRSVHPINLATTSRKYRKPKVFERADWIRPTFRDSPGYYWQPPKLAIANHCHCSHLDLHHAPRWRWWCWPGPHKSSTLVSLALPYLTRTAK